MYGKPLSVLILISVPALYLGACSSNDEDSSDKGGSGANADDNSDSDDDGPAKGAKDAGTKLMDAGHAALDATVKPAATGPHLDAGAPAPDEKADRGHVTPDAGGAGSGSFEACTQALKAKCRYDEKETACSSFTTASIPLSSGGTYGDIELEMGPYGAYVEWNDGEGFKNGVSALEDACDLAAAVFGEPQSVTDDVLDLRGQDLGLYTVFRPACWKDGEKYPVITWGNGTCGQAGGYGGLLTAVASHGFVVFAPNSRWVGEGNDEMLKALDFAKAANEDPSSIYYGKLDLDKVGAMGHSQGSGATATAASDPRIKAVILWNAGTSAMKPFLAVSGDRDITGYTPQSMTDGVNDASQPGAWLYYHKVLETGGNVTGHLTIMEQPDRVADPAIAWWKYILNDDSEAKKMFVGDDCGLCNNTDEFEYREKGLQ